MNIHPIDGNWFCLRDRERHRGRKPHKLLMRLLGCSYIAAQSMLEDRTDLQSIRDRLCNDVHKTSAIQNVNGEDPVNDKEKGLTKISPDSELHKRFCKYLKRRGYDDIHIPMLTKLYGLMCALVGRFQNRIVFPVRVHRKLVGYTGRRIDNGGLRYLSHPGAAIKRHILWYDLLRKDRPGGCLYLCEGPFDAMRLDYVARVSGLQDRATCLFTTSATPEQIEEIHKVKKLFKSICIVLDNGALAKAMILKSLLTSCNAKVTSLPSDIDDPGELTWEHALGFLHR